MKKSIVVLLILCMLLFSGCSMGVDLDAKENDLVAEFAAGILIPYSYLYEDRYDTWKTTEEETTAPGEEPTIPDEEPTIPDEEPTEDVTEDSTEDATGEVGTGEDGTGEGNPVIKPSDENPSQGNDPDKTKLELCEVFGTHPVEIIYTGYEVCEGYDIAGGLFEITPEHGCKFVVVKFNVHNKSFEDKIISTVDKEVIIRGIFNGNTRTNNYDTAVVANDLTVLKDVKLESAEKYEAVLFFMVPSDVADNIDSLVLEVANNMDQKGQLIIK